jgi:hypothetical protein
LLDGEVTSRGVLAELHDFLVEIENADGDISEAVFTSEELTDAVCQRLLKVGCRLQGRRLACCDSTAHACERL